MAGTTFCPLLFTVLLRHCHVARASTIKFLCSASVPGHGPQATGALGYLIGRLTRRAQAARAIQESLRGLPVRGLIAPNNSFKPSPHRYGFDLTVGQGGPA